MTVPKSTGRQSIQNWGSPLPIFRWAHRAVHFTIDAAAEADNALLPRFWSMADNGLVQPWRGERPWWNPPFWQLYDWNGKAVRECEENGVTSMGLMPAAIETDWFWEFAKRGQIFGFRPRPKYRFPKAPHDKNGLLIPREKWPKSVDGPPITSMCVLFEPGRLRPADADTFEITIIDTRTLSAANDDVELPARAEKAG